MYIKKDLRKRIDELNNFVDTFSNTKEFYDFIETKKIYIALKEDNNYICSRCDSHFKSKKKINQYDICPNCNQKLLLKRTINCEIKDYVMYLIKYGKDFIIRNYEVYSYYSQRKMKHIVTEYARQVISKDGTLGLKIMINNMRRNTAGYWYINYLEKTEYWKPEYYISTFGSVFVDKNVLTSRYWNPKELLDNAEVNICDIIKGIFKEDYTLELLVKSKLYNLAAQYYEFKKGSFDKVFGLDRSYLLFMIENNITYEELEVLKKIKIKDINLIRYLSRVFILTELLKYCKPYDLMKYKVAAKDSFLFRDYLAMANKLNYNMNDKKVLYPKNLKKSHDQVQNLLKMKKDKKLNKKIRERFNQIEKNKYSDNKYCIFPAMNIEQLYDESAQQNNCVKTYAERIAEGSCDIYFMRLNESKDKSLVTIEVRENKIVQKRTKNNERTTESQDRFLKLWENKILKGIC